jgi:hypothetical protein
LAVVAVVVVVVVTVVACVAVETAVAVVVVVVAVVVVAVVAVVVVVVAVVVAVVVVAAVVAAGSRRSRSSRDSRSIAGVLGPMYSLQVSRLWMAGVFHWSHVTQDLNDNLFDFDVTWTSHHVVPSCGTNIGPIEFILVRDDHAREREYADPLFGPIPARELGGGLPRARTRRRRKASFGHVEARY